MINALIIEDEPKAADLLEIMLKRNQPDVLVLEKCSNLPEGVRGIKKHKPDIVFLDIEMPGYSGLQLLEFFGENEVDFEIVFTTAFNEYAIKAFELSAIDYILKPIQIDKLNAAVEKFRKRQQKQVAAGARLQILQHNMHHGPKRIAVPVSSGIEIVKLEDIVYLQAEGSYTKMVLAHDPPLVLSKNLKYFEDQVGDEPVFFRNHRSYIVNTTFIKKVLRSDGGALQLINGTQLPITADRIDALLGLLA